MGRAVSGFPIAAQGLVNVFGRVGADAMEKTAEVGERVDLESFAGGDEAGEDGGGSPTFIAAEEEPVFASEGNSPEPSLRARWCP